MKLWTYGTGYCDDHGRVDDPEPQAGQPVWLFRWICNQWCEQNNVGHDNMFYTPMPVELVFVHRSFWTVGLYYLWRSWAWHVHNTIYKIKMRWL